MNYTHHSNFTPQRTRHRVFARWLLLVLLLALPVPMQAQFNYSINNGTVTITGYTGPGGAVTIPDSINGLPVTSIGYNAFTDCAGLTNLTVPNSLTSIGRQAFWHCTNLVSISVDGLNSTYSSVNGVLFDKTQTTLVQYPPGIAAAFYTIPDSVTSIGEGAFEFGARLTDVSIPNGVTSIGDYAFWACNSLTSPAIPNSVTNIGDSAFAECTSLTSITIPNRVTRIGVGTFGDCTRLTSITIPGSVTTIGTNAFFDCTGLASVTIGSGVTDIRLFAFYECTNLTALHFDGNAPSLGAYVFQGDNRATVYYLPGTTGWGSTFGGLPAALWPPPPGAWTSSASTITPTGATLNGTVNPNGWPTTAWFQWGDTTNYGNLTSVTNLASGITALPLSAPLAGLTLHVTYHFRIAATNDNGLAYGSDQSFTTDTSPTEFNYTINNGTITITGYTGPGGAVIIPNTLNNLPVTSIGSLAFYECPMRSVTIPDSVISIGDSAFYACLNLTSITIPNSVTSVGVGAFGWCTSLTNVTIGNGVTSIWDDLFFECTSLKGVYFEGNAPTLTGVDVFQGDNHATVYYLPGTTGWGSTFGGLPTALWQPPPPGAWTLAASTITPTGATLNGTVNPNGSLTAAWFQWGTTTTYGNVTPVTGMGSGTNALALAAPVAGLVLGTTYHFRAAATSIAGVAYGSDRSFIAAGAGGMVTNCTEADLRAAMAGGGTVTFVCDGTITLASTITIAADTVLDASGHQITINGNGAMRVFYVDSNVSFSVISLTVANGFCNDRGAGILNDGGMVNLIGVTLTGNRVANSYDGGTGRGGAICNLGRLTVRTSSFLTNQASGERGYDGCCIWASPGGSGGSGLGGALDNEGTASIASSTFVGNLAYGGQGGAGAMGDHAGGKGGAGGAGGLAVGAVNNQGSIDLVNCTFASNGAYGGAGGTGGEGGYYMFGGGPGGAGGDGGAGGSACSCIQGEAGITNCTIAWNVAQGGSGGPGGPGGPGLPLGSYPDGPPGTNGPDGSAAGGFSGGQLLNTLIAYNTPSNCSGTATDAGHNLSSDASCAFTSSGSMNNTDPKLGPLADNGGPTLTMALLPGSPAIDAGNTSLAPSTDQRGFQRPAGLAADIGAYEYGAGPPLVSTLPATGVSTNSATLNGTANPNGWPTTAWFQWGVTTNYGNLTPKTAPGSGTTALPLSAPLDGLAPGVNYHFRVAARNDDGLAYGSDQSFTTATLTSEFNYTINNGTITITGYTGAGGAVTIPSTFNGLPVIVIGTNAFLACSNLTSVTIPNSVTNISFQAFAGCYCLTNVTIGNSVTAIGSSAFVGCSSMTDITMPNSVTGIGDEAFEGCSSLTTVTIPTSVTDMGYSAFSGCTSLTSVMIPNSLTNIGVQPFAGCTSLTAIAVGALNPAYCSVDGVLFNKSQTTLIQCPGGKAGTYMIPNGVTNIGGYAFSGCAYLTNIMIPTSLTSIGYAAFEECLGLTSITIPNGVTSIGNSAFEWCTNLTIVTIPNSVTNIEEYAFIYCFSLTALHFGGNAPSLGGSYVFHGDNHATAYYLPGTTGWGWTFGGLPTALWTQVPTLQASPQSQTAEAASAVGLRVKASSPLPLFYYWYLNATNLLSSGTNWQLELTNLQGSQSGAYTVVVSNVLGAITSAPVMLQVIAPVERRPVPGVKLMGATGSQLNVDYADSLDPAPNWTPLGSVSLTSTSQYCFDLTLPLLPQRFYRAWETGTPGGRASLDLHLVPAITLTGTIGHSVRVDAINQVGPIDAWFTLDTVTLTNTSQLYFDVSAPAQPERLYRLIQVP